MTAHEEGALLLTGASGCVGAAVLREAAGTSFEVLGLTRSGRLPVSGANITAIKGTLATLPGQLDGLPRVERCIHAAAAVHDQVSDEGTIFAINVESSCTLASHLARRGDLRRFVFVSTIAAIADDGQPLHTAYARSKAAAEQRLLDLAAEYRFELSILRLGTVYGPGDRGNIRSLYDAIRRRRYLRVAPANTLKSLISAEAAATGLLVASDPNTPVPVATTLVDPDPYRLAEIEDALAEAADVRPPRRLWMPLARGASLAGTAVEALTGRSVPLNICRLQTLARKVDIRPGPPSPITEAAKTCHRPLADALKTSYSPVDLTA